MHDVLSICIVDASGHGTREGRVPTLVGNVSEVVGSFPKGELLVFFAWRRGKFMLC